MSTLKQRRVASKMVENGGNLGKAMIAAGYSKSMAKNPQKLTRSKGWQTLMNKYYSDTKLAKIHSKLLDASSITNFTFPSSMSDKDIKQVVEYTSQFHLIRVLRNKKLAYAYVSIPDNATQLKSLELAYKVKGKMNVDSETDEKYDAELEAVVLRVRKILPAAGQ